MPKQAVLELHENHSCFETFEAFLPELEELLRQSDLLDECVALNRCLGFLEPLTGEHIPPEALLIEGPNWRESIVGNGLLSRNRAVLFLLQRFNGSLEALREQDVFLAEALTGFALWMRRHLGGQRLTCSEFLDDSVLRPSDIPHQDLCALTFDTASFDLVLCNELFEHVQHMERAFAEIARVLRPGGRLVATCPLAFGQVESVIKALADPVSGATQLLCDAELHGDPIRPDQGSLVFRIPGWSILEQLREHGFREARIHHVCSWKHGVLGSDLPGVLVIEAQR